MEIENRDTLKLFVLRARRIAEHSLMQDKTALEAYARGTWKIQTNLGGDATFVQKLPQEEMFESLASRIRPLTLKSEPIHHARVTEALKTAIKAAPHEDGAALLSEVERLVTAWNAVDLTQNSRLGYRTQWWKESEDKASPVVDDRQLGAGWFYADVAHADAQGWKKDSLQFSLVDRYAAAVGRFSQIALVTLQTLKFIEHIQRLKIIDLSSDAFEQEVVIRQSEVRMQGRAIAKSFLMG